MTEVVNKEIEFKSSEYILKGTFTQPKDVKPLAYVLMINGSGPIDRNSNMKIQELNISNQIANELAKSGIASYRYDKRGSGESQGDFWKTSFEEEVNDARLALKTLANENSLSKPQIVLGHSVGATIAMQLAASEKSVNGCILLAGAAQSGLKVMKWQSQRIGETFPFFTRLFFKSKFMKDQENFRNAMLNAPDDATKIGEQQINVKWMKQYMNLDPSPTLKQIKVPTLAITGKKDVQVDYNDLELMRTIIQSFTSESPDNLSHILREGSEAPGLASYAVQLNRPISADLITKLIKWIQDLEK